MGRRTSNSNLSERPSKKLKTNHFPDIVAINAIIAEEAELTSNPDLFGYHYDSPLVYLHMADKNDDSLGLGVFAKSDIPKGITVTNYNGTVTLPPSHELQMKKEFLTHVKSLLKDTRVIFGLQRPIPWLGVGSFINSSSDPSLINCKLSLSNHEMSAFVLSSRDIKMGDQLFLNYALV